MSFFKTLCFSILFFTISFNQAGRAEGSTPTEGYKTPVDAYVAESHDVAYTQLLRPICKDTASSPTNAQPMPGFKAPLKPNSRQLRQDSEIQTPPPPLTEVLEKRADSEIPFADSAFQKVRLVKRNSESLLYTPAKGSISNHPKVANTRPLRTLSIDPTFTSGGDTDIDSDAAVIKKSNTRESVQSRNSVSQTPSLTIHIPTPGPLSARSQSRQGHNSINGQVNSSDVHQPDAYETIRPILVTLQYILLTTALLVFIAVILYSIYYIRLIKEIYDQKEFVVE